MLRAKGAGRKAKARLNVAIVGRDTGVLVGGHGPRIGGGLGAGDEKRSGVHVEVCDARLRFAEGRGHAVGQPEVQAKGRRHGPFILCIASILLPSSTDYTTIYLFLPL